MGQGDFGQDGTALQGRPRPHYTYSRKSTYKRNRGAASGGELTDNEDGDSNSKVVGSCSPLLDTAVVFSICLMRSCLIRR